MKVQWRLALCCAVVFIGWISADEGNRRKVIIHVPHMHHTHHKHSQRHLHKSHGHNSKGHSRPGGSIHKHHHHFHDDETEEPSHSHGFDDHGHHHTPHHHHSRSRPHHHSHPSHHHHSHSSHHHSHPSHHHSDHHGHSSHHVSHHRHPEDHDDLDHHYRAEESQYSHDHHGDYSHHHHRPHHYVDHDSDYDCIEVCEKCKMKYHRHHMGLSRGHDIMRTEDENPISATHPQLTVANFKQAPTSPSAVHGSYSVRVNEDFKPILAAGELSETPSAYGGGKVVQGGHNYGGYVLPTAMEQAVASNSGKVNSPVRHKEHGSEFDISFPNFPSSDFQPNGNWYNSSYYYTKHEDPSQNAVGYHQRGQVQQTRYVEEGTHHVDNKNNDGRGRDLRYLNRYKYDINR